MKNKLESAVKSKSASPGNLKSLFVATLKDIYWAEKHLVKSLPKFLKKLSNQDLKKTIENHLSETNEQVVRVEKVFNLSDVKVSAKKCEAMAGLVEELKQTGEMFPPGPLLDAALIIGLQKIEHYEIATYGSLHVLADVLELEESSGLLKQILDEEHEADYSLNELAKEINKAAFNHSQKKAMVNVAEPMEVS